MGFSPKIKEEALVRSRRCCCICHRFAGVFTNVHHIIQEADGGSDELENAIVLCLECHGQVGHYNERHPIGNKYVPSEVRRHRDEWWAWCEKNPAAPLPQDPISLSPNVFNIPAGNWNCKATLIAYNRTETTYYAIWIKFGLEDLGLRPEELVIDNFASPAMLQASLGAFKISGDAVILTGNDESGKNALYILVSSIGPRSSVNFQIATQKNSEPKNAQQIPIMLLAFSCDPQPAPILHRDGEVALPFQPPENLTMRSVRIRLEAC